jgi:hypothetical protein
MSNMVFRQNWLHYKSLRIFSGKAVWIFNTQEERGRSDPPDGQQYFTEPGKTTGTTTLQRELRVLPRNPQIFKHKTSVI